MDVFQSLISKKFLRSVRLKFDQLCCFSQTISGCINNSFSKHALKNQDRKIWDNEHMLIIISADGCTLSVPIFTIIYDYQAKLSMV